MTANARICTDLHGLGPEQLRAVSLKITGRSWSKVAAEMGVAESTVTRWRQQYPEMRRMVLEARAENVENAKDLMSGALSVAVRTLVKICKDPTAEHRDKIAASGKLLEIATKKDADKPSADSRDGAANERAGPEPAGVIDALADDADDEAIERRIRALDAEVEGVEEG